MRFCAVDWSGAISGERQSIWSATVRDGTVESLETGRSRPETIQYLVELADEDPDLVVGLDFGFSFPAWFFFEHKLESVGELWDLVAREGEGWLADCEPPFWGRAGKTCPLPAERQFRRTEREAPRIGSSAPQSVFKINGAGSVGTGSIRGMPFLRDLRAAGFSVWPFDPVRLPTVVEIYPRALTKAVRKSDLQARVSYLARGDWPIGEFGALAQSSDHAFDALISAVAMARYADQLALLVQATHETTLLEGAIWLPIEESSAAGSPRLVPVTTSPR